MDNVLSIKGLAPSDLGDFTTIALLLLGAIGFVSKGKFWSKPDVYHEHWFHRPQDLTNEHGTTQKTTRDIAQKLEESTKQVVIFWGSQSGTAEGFANRLAREWHLRFGLEVLVADLSDYDIGTICKIPKTKLAIFILSTFGEGDPSDNSAGLWHWIRQSPPLLPNLRYAAFGLGNSNYKHYNRVVDVVVDALTKATATALLPAGRADDASGGTEEDFISWKMDVSEILRTTLKLTERTLSFEPSVNVREDKSLDIIDLYHGEPVVQRATSKAVVHPITITSAHEIFSDSNRNCLHVDIDLTDLPEMVYKTGDHLSIWPVNPSCEVNRLLRLLGLTERQDNPITIEAVSKDVRVRIPTPTTIIALLRHYLEICSPVSRDVVLFLAQLAPTQAASTLLRNLGKSKEAFADFQGREIVTFGRLLEYAAGPDTLWDNLPLAFMVDNLKQMQPRYYSISSSSMISPRHPSITAVVSKNSLANNPVTHIYGVTTNYLLAIKGSVSLPVGTPSPYELSNQNNGLSSSKVFAQVRRSKFRLPTLASHPIVMVAAGTGIAPFRAFISERARLKVMGKPVGRMLLFYGCRRSDEDYLYQQELSELQESLGRLENSASQTLQIITAFSRETDCKVYVQDRIAQKADEVCEMLADHDASFYVCGSAKMAREVARSVEGILQKQRGFDELKWRQWSEAKKGTNRWQEDVWG